MKVFDACKRNVWVGHLSVGQRTCAGIRPLTGMSKADTPIQVFISLSVSLALLLFSHQADQEGRQCGLCELEAILLMTDGDVIQHHADVIFRLKHKQPWIDDLHTIQA